MARLQLNMLGSLQIMLDGAPVSGFESDKVRGLLVYLAAESDRPHRREYLASLFWPDLPLQPARNNLRQALANLRTAIDDRRAQPPFLHITRGEIQFNAQSDCTIDCRVVQEVLASVPVRLAGAPEIDGDILCALQSYRGDFLAQFRVPGAPRFEEWLHVRQTYLRRIYLNALGAVAQAYFERGDYARAEQLTLQELAHEAWREAAHRRLMRVYAVQGRAAEALAQFEQCRVIVARELEMEPMAETVALCEEIRQGRFSTPGVVASVTLHPLAGQSPARAAIPHYATPCIGRDALCQEIVSLLQEGGATANGAERPRLVTLVGTGGMGKTRLAVAVAERLDAPATGVENGVEDRARNVVGKARAAMVYVSLVDAPREQHFWAALAAALNFRFSEGEEPRNQLLGRLTEASCVLVLDNLDSVAERATLIADVLAAGPGVRILATARERLQLRAEYALEIPGLAFPAPESGPLDSEKTIAQRYAAIELFVQSAQRSDPHFALAATNVPHVVEICRLVEGMPLAIELAGAWVRALSCSEIAAALAHSLDILTTPSLLRDLPNIQAGWRYALAQWRGEAVIRYADHLGNLYARLNRHREALEHAGEVLAWLAHGDDPTAARDESMLLAAHWQRRQGEAYYRLGRLPESLQALQACLPTLDSQTQLAAAAMGRASLLVGIGREFWRQFRYRVPGRPLPPARVIGLASDPPALDPHHEAACVYERLGQLYFFDGKTLPSLYTAIRGLNLAETVGPAPILSRLFANTCLAAGLASLHAIARRYAALAEATARQVGEPATLIWALELTGMYFLGIGAWQKAHAAGQEAAQLAEQWGDQRRGEECIALLASLEQVQGKLDAARARWQVLAHTAQGLGHRQVMAWGMSGEAECLLFQEQPARAQELLEASLVIHRDDGDRTSQACDYGTLALAHWQQGDSSRALELARKSLTLFARCSPTALTAREGYCAVAQVFILAWAQTMRDAPGSLSTRELAHHARQAMRQLRQFAGVFPIAQPRAYLWQSVYHAAAVGPWHTAQARRARRRGLAVAQRLGMVWEINLLHNIHNEVNQVFE